MDETGRAAEDITPHPAAKGDEPEGLRSALAAVATRATEACGALACGIAWRSAGRGGVVYLPTDARSRPALAAVLAMAERQFEHLPAAAETTRLGLGQLAPLVTDRLSRGAALEGTAARAARGDRRVLTILLTPVGRSDGELAALANLTNEYVLAVMSGEAAELSRDFWMSEGATARTRLATTKAELAAMIDERVALDNALTRCAKLKPSARFAGLGALFARAGSFDGWLVALSADGGPRIEAISPGFAALGWLDPSGPLVECIARQAVIVGTTGPSAGNYLCVPCSRGAVALATSREPEPGLVKKLERLAVLVAPIVERWLAEAEVDRLHGLVRDLGLRMFTAVDRERQRIARDLHDHQTQLLTAARIALEADPGQTRAILKQLDESLRAHLREIRPVSLGRSTLHEALGFEMNRLGDAGIRGKLIYARRRPRLSRPVQELCYQVAREAISNVIRHSKASRLEASIERRGGQVVLRVEDNGHGPPARVDPAGGGESTGVGLAGMRERLELMGGRLRIERVGKLTRLTAEIPEL